MLRWEFAVTSGEYSMKIYLLMTGSGPIVITTSHQDVADPELLKKLAAKGMDKFIAYRYS